MQSDHLPFHDWLEKTYPQKTTMRSFLHVIGAMDLLYLLYRMKPASKKESGLHELPQVDRAIRTTAKKSPSEKKKRPAPKKASPRKKTVKPKTAVAPATKDDARNDPETATADEEAMSSPVRKEAAAPERETTAVWLDDPRLDEADLLKTDLPLGLPGIRVEFEKRTADDEEVLLVVNGVPFRIMLPSPALNLSGMVQMLRVRSGEFYALGRMALGALSGEGYVTAEEAKRIVSEVAATEERSFTLGVSYFKKDASSQSRTASVLTVRFERTA